MTNALPPGATRTRSLLDEPIRVETAARNGHSSWTVGIVGSQSERFRGVTLSETDPQSITILNSTLTYTGKAGLLRLAIPAHYLGNERRVAKHHRDCYRLYIITNCCETPTLMEPIKDPARFAWNEVREVQHYWLSVETLNHKGPCSEARGSNG